MISWVENLFVQQMLGVIRHVLTTFAGAMVAHGLMTNDQQTTIVAGALAFLTVVWSLVQKQRVAEAVAVIKAAAAPQG